MLLTTKEVMRYVRISSRKTLYNWMNKGKFPMPYKFGGQNRWRMEDVVEWMCNRSSNRSNSLDIVHQVDDSLSPRPRTRQRQP